MGARIVDIVAKDGVREVVGRLGSLRFIPFIRGCPNSKFPGCGFFSLVEMVVDDHL